jgi:hypothetical protein
MQEAKAHHSASSCSTISATTLVANEVGLEKEANLEI